MEFNNAFYDFCLVANDHDNAIKELPLGMYEASLNRIELKTSKKGKPMISAQFTVEYAGERTDLVGEHHWCHFLILNSVDPKDTRNKFFFTKAVAFLNSLGYDEPLNSLSDIEAAIDDISSKLVEQRLSYEIQIADNKGFKTTFVIARLADA